MQQVHKSNYTYAPTAPTSPRPRPHQHGRQRGKRSIGSILYVQTLKIITQEKALQSAKVISPMPSRTSTGTGLWFGGPHRSYGVPSMTPRLLPPLGVLLARQWSGFYRVVMTFQMK